MVGFVQGGAAAGAGVDAGGGIVLVVGAAAGGFGAFFAEDAELLWIGEGIRMGRRRVKRGREGRRRG